MRKKFLYFGRKAAIGTVSTSASEGWVLHVWCGFVVRTLVTKQRNVYVPGRW
jgi:hypothetical protein